MDNSGIIEIGQKKEVGVAYTLNNYQPVRCSHIGADPFFFVDVDVEDSEDEMDFLMNMEDLDHDLDRLHQKLTSYERYSEEEGPTTQSRISSFEEDLLDITGFDREARYAPTIDSVISLIEKSRFAAAMVEKAQKAGVSIHYSEQVMVSEYDKEAGKIFLNPNRKLPDVVLALAGELRSLWQYEAGAGVHPLAFDPDQAILVNRMKIADRAVAMVRTGWELSLADYKSVWTRLEQSSLEDVARSFAREAFLDFRTLNNGEAASAAFETWFLSDRCREHDRSLIQAMLTDTYTKVFVAQGEIVKNAVLKLIGRLGEMPFGKNYLAQYAGLITQDPIFTDVRDRSNANFLWFIKFEQSFHGVEQELQSSSHHISGHPNLSGGLDFQPSDKRESNAQNTKPPYGHPKGTSNGRGVSHQQTPSQKTLDRSNLEGEGKDSQKFEAYGENIIGLPFGREDNNVLEDAGPKRASGESHGGSASIVLFPKST